MSGGGNSGQQSGVSANYMVNGPGGGGSMPSTSAQQMPQWLQGMKLGTQLAQQGMGMAGQQQRPPMQPQMPQRPMGMVGAQGGMQQGAVPGSVPQLPQQPGMMSGGMGMPQQQGGINPQLLAMLMRSQQR